MAVVKIRKGVGENRVQLEGISGGGVLMLSLVSELRRWMESELME